MTYDESFRLAVELARAGLCGTPQPDWPEGPVNRAGFVAGLKAFNTRAAELFDPIADRISDDIHVQEILRREIDEVLAPLALLAAKFER